MLDKIKIRNYMNLFIIVGLFVFLFLQCWFAVITTRYPYLGIKLEYKNNQWVLDRFDHKELAHRHQLKAGNQLISIEGDLPIHHPTVRRWHSLEQAEYIVINQGGTLRLIDLAHEPLHLFSGILPFASGLITLFLVFYIGYKERMSVSMKFLSCILFIMFIIYMSMGAMLRGDCIGQNITWGALMLSPVVFLHFLAQFFYEKAGIPYAIRSFRICYKIIAIYIVLKAILLMTNYVYDVYKVDHMISNWVPLIGGIFNFYWVTVKYYHYRKSSPQIASILGYVLAWMGIAFTPLLIMSYAPILLNLEPLVSPLLTGWLTLLFPISFTYLHRFEKLSDLEIVIKKVLSVMLIAIFPSALVVGLSAIIFVERHSFIQHMFSFGFIVLVLAAVLYSFPFFNQKLMTVIHPNNFVLVESLQHITAKLNVLDTFQEWGKVILPTFVQSLKVEGAAFVIKNLHHDIELYFEGKVNAYDIEHKVRSGQFTTGKISWFEIERHATYAAYFVLVHKQVGEELNMEEKKWMHQLMQYMNIGMRKMMKIRQLTTQVQQVEKESKNHLDTLESIMTGPCILEKLFHLIEQDRAKLVHTLQQTVMYSLHQIGMQVETMQSLAKNDDLREKLFTVDKKATDVNIILQHFCLSLEPQLIYTAGFTNAVLQYIKGEFSTLKSRVQFCVNQKTSIEAQTSELKVHLFRIVQELLQNSLHHAYAEQIILLLQRRERYIDIHYEDNGVGFEPRTVFCDHAKIKGLKLMRIRVLMLNGSMTWKSDPGKGVRMDISIPCSDMYK